MAEIRNNTENLLSGLKSFAKRQSPDFLKPLLRELNFRFVEPKSRVNNEVVHLQNQWRNVIENSKSLLTLNTSPEGQNLLFVTGFGLGTAFLTVEPLLMMSLYVRGCKISSLFCDVTLPACEFNPWGNNRPSSGLFSMGITEKVVLYKCKECSANVSSTYSLFPVDLYKYNQYVSESDLIEAQKIAREVSFKEFREFEYSGIKVGEEVFSSILRSTLRGTVDDNTLNRTLVERFLISGILMTIAAERAFGGIKPDRVVMPHGVYLTHGIASKVANKMSIPAIVYGGAYRKNTIVLSHKETYHRTLVNEPNDVWEKNELTPDQKKQLWEYLHSKQGGGCDYVSYHPNPIEDKQILYDSLQIDGSREVVSLYTNVIWDAQIYYDFNVFKNIFEWVFTTIDELSKNKKVWLVIRIHPAEVKGGLPTKQPFLDEIKSRYPVLPENVRIILPESDLSSYTLAENSRAAIIYGTKMGLEIVARGIPLIVCGETFNRNKGFATDITSKEQYIELLKNIHTLDRLDENTIERALKYAYYYFFRRMIPMKQLTFNDPRSLKDKKIEFKALGDLKVGKDKNLDVICDGIIKLKPFYLEN